MYVSKLCSEACIFRPPISSQDSPFQLGPRYKFFPPLATFDPPYPVAPDGYLPNSVTLQQLRKSAADQELARQWKPPSLSEKQLRLMEEMKEVIIRIISTL